MFAGFMWVPQWPQEWRRLTDRFGNDHKNIRLSNYQKIIILPQRRKRNDRCDVIDATDANMNVNTLTAID